MDYIINQTKYKQTTDDNDRDGDATACGATL